MGKAWSFTASNNELLYLLFFIIILLLLLFLYLNCSKYYPEFFGSELTFSAPLSLTSLNSRGNQEINIIVSKQNIDEIIKKLKSISHHDEKGFHTNHLPEPLPGTDPHHIHLENGNFLTFPAYFSAWDKWPGCLPSPLFQGDCGSCWAFAVVTSISSRFYIESCGSNGCGKYPQFNQQALDTILNNIDSIYKFTKISLSKIVKNIDIDKDGDINKSEWLDTVKEAHKTALYDKLNNYKGLQALIYLLNFQSLGSITFSKTNPNLKEILDRAKKTFEAWNINGVINLKTWKEDWLKKPITLSAEKLIACCYPACYSEKGLLLKESVNKNNPQCKGGTLIDAWKILRDTGTTTSLCIGYNLDKWKENDPEKSCKELLGPNYSYCSGYSVGVEGWKTKYDKVIKETEQSGLEPVLLNEKNERMDLPWTNPQFFRFKAKNAYKVNNSMTNIQREIFERGPVTTGFEVYSDFQYEFGAKGLGGQKYSENSKYVVGGKNDCLIYMHIEDGTKPISGHAITITGWGTYKDIPYWICLNSWGVEWGTSGWTKDYDKAGLPNKLLGGGYFWFVRGINNCKFEDNVVAGQPNLSNISYPGTIRDYGWGLPYPELNDVELIPPLKSEVTIDDDGVNIKLPDPIEGGGQYVVSEKKNWVLKSMDPPSPFSFFWKTERPTYILGKSINSLNKSLISTTLVVDSTTVENLRKIIKIQKNPIFIMNNEQMQFVMFEQQQGVENFTKIKFPYSFKQKSSNNFTKIKVLRDLSKNSVEFHPEGSTILIFPFRDLYMKDLEFLEKNNKINVECDLNGLN